jgi:hypothetical protein
MRFYIARLFYKKYFVIKYYNYNLFTNTNRVANTNIIYYYRELVSLHVLISVKVLQ